MDDMNVKVAVRVRPVLQRELLAGDQSCVRVLNSSNQILIGKDRSFTYDYVFGLKSAQGEVYDQCFQPLINACFEGYNCTVFAYGQTGSGKTYTIGGNIGLLTEEEYGILPRAIGDLFEHMKGNDKIEYKVRVSYFEVYKEELCDLLDSESPNKELSIREDEMGNTVIIGAEEVLCESLDDVMACLESGSAIRHTGSTQMNEHSSRSHSIFTILIEQKWTENEAETNKELVIGDDDEVIDDDVIHCYKYSKFHFVDLAGSERAQKTGNVGERFKESIHINTGLLAVGNVISALGDPKKKVAHIPYRDAKITRILKDSLGGNAKTLMICCVSPCVSSMDESLNSLKYANRARNIKNKPVINRDRQTLLFEEMQSEIMHLREELARQRTSLYSGDSEARSARTAEKRQLEDQLSRLRTECSHYRMLAEEAYKQLMEIHSCKMLSKSQNTRLQDWLDLVDELNNRVFSPSSSRTQWDNESLKQLQKQLQKAKDDLKNDEQIFVDKNKEITTLQGKISELEAANRELAEGHEQLTRKTSNQADQLVQLQTKIIEDGKGKHSVRIFSTGSSQNDEAFLEDDQAPISARRVKSVPASALRRQYSDDRKPTARNIHTSPGLISLDRVMQGFRARSQLLANQLDEDDSVRQRLFNQDSLTDDERQENDSNLIRHGTYKLKRASSQHPSLPDIDSQTDAKRSSKSAKNEQFVSEIIDEMNLKQLQEGADSQRRKIKESQMKLQNANQKMRDLAINIRLKEQLIRDLVRSGKEADTVNRQYAEKIKNLEKEKTQARGEVAELQKAFNDLAGKGQQGTQKRQIEVQRKLEAAKNRMQAVQRKQREVEKVANISGHTKNKIQELEGAIEKMKHQQDLLQRKLKEESDRKEKLEREMTKEQQRINDLEIRNEQQQKILKRKTEEIAAVQRRLRNESGPHSDEQGKIDEQKKWLDGEIDRVVQLRQNMESLQEDLKKREEIVQKREDIMTEKSRLEMKKLRSSQTLNKDMLSVVNKLADVEQQLSRKSHDFQNASAERREAFKQDLRSLQGNRQELIDKRNFYDEKLHLGSVLSDEEERRLIELDEAVEALDVAIDYKSDAIKNHEQHIRQSQSQIILKGESDFSAKLGVISNNDCRTLLIKYFERVIELRESERKRSLKCSEYEVRTEEQDRLIRELEASLDHCRSELDRRLTHQQQVYEKKIQTLLHQLSAQTASLAVDPELTERIAELEKDLYYYKKTSRDLKRKLKELTGESQPSTPKGDDNRGDMEIIGRSIEGRQFSARGEPLPSSRPASVRTAHNGGTPRSARTEAPSRQKSDVRAGSVDVTSARTPARMSKKDLSSHEEETTLRKSTLGLTDSLEPNNASNSASKNPWS